MQDALRQNDLVLEEGVVLRIPVLGYRLMEDRFTRQVAALLAAAAARGSCVTQERVPIPASA